MPDPSKIKAVMFDIGGVVVGSPIVGVLSAEQQYGLPENYLNALITAHGHNGAFQKLERGEVSLAEFYKAFGTEMSDITIGNKAYQIYCRKTKKECPALPTSLNVDGEKLWAIMMAPALEPDPIVLTAINHLRASKKFKLAALTNNFTVPEAAPVQNGKVVASLSVSLPSQTKQGYLLEGPVSIDQLRESLIEAALNSSAKGSPTNLMKLLFDHFIESSVEKLRKPDPKFFQLALDRLQLKGDQVVFLDDIGINLSAAQKLGINTIRVNPNRSIDAVKQLEQWVGLDLTTPLNGQAKL